MKHESCTIVFAILALLLFNVIASGVSLRTVKANTQTTTVQFYNIGAGQTSLTNETTHTSPYVAELVIPSSAPQGSGCMVLYPYNKTLNSLQSFQVYTSYANAVPRFVMLLDTNGDCLTDVVLLSDYQFTSNGNWQISQGGQRWGWSEASPDLSTYGNGWNDTSYWKGIYGNATVLSVGVALEYWAVKDSNGLGQSLYADELVLNGVTYNIAPPPNQPPNGSTPDDWPMFHHDPQHTGNSASAASDGNLLYVLQLLQRQLLPLNQQQLPHQCRPPRLHQHQQLHLHLLPLRSQLRLQVLQQRLPPLQYLQPNPRQDQCLILTKTKTIPETRLYWESLSLQQ